MQLRGNCHSRTAYSPCRRDFSMRRFTTEPLKRTPGQGGYGLPRSEDPLAAVRRLRPMIEAVAAESEENGRLDDDVVAALVAAGTMTLMVPASLGGGEADPSVQLDVI